MSCGLFRSVSSCLKESYNRFKYNYVDDGVTSKSVDILPIRGTMPGSGGDGGQGGAEGLPGQIKIIGLNWRAGKDIPSEIGNLYKFIKRNNRNLIVNHNR